MHVIYLAAGIAAGKSTFARMMSERGAEVIDLDILAREILEPGSAVLEELAREFGDDILDESGTLRRELLAERAFASVEKTNRLEEIEHPAILALLEQKLKQLSERPVPPRFVVVEIPLLDHMGEAMRLADEVVVVSCPVELRRERAIGRGMTGEDFDARAAQQPSEEWLRSQADVVFDNSGSQADLERSIAEWLERREASGWPSRAE